MAWYSLVVRAPDLRSTGSGFGSSRGAVDYSRSRTFLYRAVQFAALQKQ